MKTYEDSANRKANRQLLKFADGTNKFHQGPPKCNLRPEFPFLVYTSEFKLKALTNGISTIIK
jgi:hypothetical protein